MEIKLKTRITLEEINYRKQNFEHLIYYNHNKILTKLKYIFVKES